MGKLTILTWQNGAANFDSLQINIPFGPIAPPVEWYCTWIVNPPNGLPYMNNGNTASPGNANLIIPPGSPFPPLIYLITEITVFNPSPIPATIEINYISGLSGVSSRLMQCVLPGGNTLSYNASPSENGGWQRYDNSAFLVSSR